MATVRVQLQAVKTGDSTYSTVAELTVHDDGAYELEDPDSFLSQEFLEFPVPVPSPDDDQQLHRVMFTDDPQTWARHLPNALRTGYLVPVVTETTDED